MAPSSDATQPEAPRSVRRGDALARPERLPERYELLEVIGAGGMGRVYRARTGMLGRDVAIKVIDTTPTGTDATQPRERFVREAQAAARLAHPNIVAVHDVDAEAGWLVMDLVTGETLRERVQRAAMSPRDVRNVAEQVLSALDAAHSSGVIHRDVKPSNILVDAQGKVTIVDFGVARLVDVELTRTGESLGTPAYMAPEQLRGGRVDARTDLYGLAATLFELVSGERMTAFETPSPAAIAKVVRMCGTERGLAHVIERCLRAHVEERFDSARDALRELSRRRRSRAPWIAAAVGLAAIAGGAAWWAARDEASAGTGARRRELFALAQRGEHDKAALLLDEFALQHPDDAEARTMKFLVSWWQSGRLIEPLAGEERLRPVQRDMLHGIALMARRQEDVAIAFLEDARRRHPRSPELDYALGEARWHGQELERGAVLLAEVFARDPSWQMALHHVLELRLSRGETEVLQPLAALLRANDPVRGAVLDCEIAIAERTFDVATDRARAALTRYEPLPELYGCLTSARVLASDIAGAEATSKEALDRAPIDLREWGTRTIAAELLLYRGRFDEYLRTVNGHAERQRVIALAVWRPRDAIVETPARADAVRGQPIVIASQLLVQHTRGRDAVDAYEHAPEIDLRLYGRGLAAERRGDLAGAAANYRQALSSPSKGDTRLLLSWQLARVLHAAGDVDGARTACGEVIAPRRYEPYRAVLLPDCLWWSGDPARWRELDAMWTGDFAHPAVVAVRSALAR